ncbi:MAG TPA: metallophosphoesterase [Candidatus Limnocylindrales bacterium]|nr:metallophosphoesterase [Candidatus Limnocylindrales bacterium]
MHRKNEVLAVAGGIVLGLVIVVVFLQLRAATPTATRPAATLPAATATQGPPSTPTPASTGPGASPAPTESSIPSVTLVGAGDIASCSSDGDSVTAKLLEGIEGTVFTLGDDAYESGSAREFRECYGPTWGRDSIKSRTMPVPGNHEYNSRNAAPYFDYFGAAAGDPIKGYYAYDLGAWRIYVLNTNTGTCSAVACDKGSAQEQWLKADLAANPHQCVLAMWHHPRYSSGRHGNNNVSAALWRDLYDAGAEIILNGHDHTYERFAPMDASGARDDATGIVEMVIGTGGKDHYEFARVQPNSLVRNASAWGVLELTLSPGSWSFQFVPEPGKSFSDSGSGTCH